MPPWRCYAHRREENDYVKSLFHVAEVQTPGDVAAAIARLDGYARRRVHLMRGDVLPVWEHEALASGGFWIVRTAEADAARAWEALVAAALDGGLAALEEESCERDSVLGVTLSRRAAYPVFQVWLACGACHTEARADGRRLLAGLLDTMACEPAAPPVFKQCRAKRGKRAPSGPSASRPAVPRRAAGEEAAGAEEAEGRAGEGEAGAVWEEAVEVAAGDVEGALRACADRFHHDCALRRFQHAAVRAALRGLFRGAREPAGLAAEIARVVSRSRAARACEREEAGSTVCEPAPPEEATEGASAASAVACEGPGDGPGPGDDPGPEEGEAGAAGRRAGARRACGREEVEARAAAARAFQEAAAVARRRAAAAAAGRARGAPKRPLPSSLLALALQALLAEAGEREAEAGARAAGGGGSEGRAGGDGVHRRGVPGRWAGLEELHAPLLAHRLLPLAARLLAPYPAPAREAFVAFCLAALGGAFEGALYRAPAPRGGRPEQPPEERTRRVPLASLVALAEELGVKERFPRLCELEEAAAVKAALYGGAVEAALALAEGRPALQRALARLLLLGVGREGLVPGGRRAFAARVALHFGLLGEAEFAPLRPDADALPRPLPPLPDFLASAGPPPQEAGEGSEFLRLPVPVAWVETAEALAELAAALQLPPAQPPAGLLVVGLDSEWRHAKRTALVQLATADRAWLLDVLALPEAGPALLAALFRSPHHLKLGFSFASDLKSLSASFPALAGTLCARQLPRPAPGARRALPSLAGAVERVLGRPLDKRPQIFNWERRPLPPAQLEYAALDAWCLVPLYHALAAPAPAPT
eukprot:tig00001029_g6433.t1